MVHANKSQLKVWENILRGRIQGLHNFFEYFLLSQEGIKLRTSDVARIFTGCIRIPLLSQERVKLRTELQILYAHS